MQSMINRLKLKNEVILTSKVILDSLIALIPSTDVYPKNRRKRLAKTPSKYPKNKFKFLQSIETQYGDDPCLTHSEVPIAVSNILLIAYASMLYCYSDTTPVLVGDILDWAYSGIIPYFTAYLDLSLPSEFQSLFKPLALPSAHWMRSSIATMKTDCIKSFRAYHSFMLKLSTEICKKLRLPSSFAELAFKLYIRSHQEVLTKKIEHILPVIFT